ncbi:hypothetical protein PAPHI01_1748 [Pancytospora philotis]|nr:hypothetical protein PAPHI01_1748 [Pancytospora philotis]
MSLEKANAAYKTVLSSASKFVSPKFKSFFVAMANDNYHCFSKNYHNDESVAKKYIEKQQGLAAVYDRVAPIYNMYSSTSPQV